MKSEMRAIEITKYGKPEVLEICTRPMPIPKEGELLIKVSAAGINRPDILQRSGYYPVPEGASDLPGLEVAGEIVGGDVRNGNFQLGDRVCALVQGGGYAEFCIAPAEQCLKVPNGLSMIEAASLPETFFTVWSNVFQRANLASGETLLVQGGTSGIGVAAIQIANALGHRVFATAGSDEKCRATEQLGAVRGINYKSENFCEVVKEMTSGKGVDVILDMVAGSYVPQEINCLADDGRLAIIALLGGGSTNLDLAQLLRRRLTVTGSTLRPRSVEFKAKIAFELQKIVWPLLESKAVKPMIYKVFPLEQAVQAHLMMEEGLHIGKIMLTMQ